MIKPIVGWFLSQKPGLEGMTDSQKYDYQIDLEDGHCDIYNCWDNEYYNEGYDGAYEGLDGTG